MYSEYICMYILRVNAIYVELTTGMKLYSIVEMSCRNVNFEVMLEKMWVE